MRGLGLAVVVTVVAFGVGVTGIPGAIVGEATSWLEGQGAVELVGPVGSAVRAAFPQADDEIGTNP